MLLKRNKHPFLCKNLAKINKESGLESLKSSYKSLMLIFRLGKQCCMASWLLGNISELYRDQ